jgi:hypothetical protein
METQEKQTRKNAYHRPQVNDYGNVAKITNTTGMGSFDDGGGMADKSA